MTEQDLTYWLNYSQDLVTELLEDGSNPDAYHVIEHHFASSDFTLLEQAAITAFKLGFEVSEPEEADLENGEKIFAFDIITEQLLDLEIITAEVRKMSDIAKQSKVDYDGWGTYFEE
jgi:regulator of ribonuclease activity B